MLDELLKAIANAGMIRKNVALAMNTKAPAVAKNKSGGGKGGRLSFYHPIIVHYWVSLIKPRTKWEKSMTPLLNPKFVVDKEQKPKAVLLTIAEWKQILRELEELEDIRAYDETKANPLDSIPFEQAVREIEEDHEG